MKTVITRQDVEEAYREGWEEGWGTLRARARMTRVSPTREDFAPDWERSRTKRLLDVQGQKLQAPLTWEDLLALVQERDALRQNLQRTQELCNRQLEELRRLRGTSGTTPSVKGEAAMPSPSEAIAMYHAGDLTGGELAEVLRRDNMPPDVVELVLTLHARAMEKPKDTRRKLGNCAECGKAVMEGDAIFGCFDWRGSWISSCATNGYLHHKACAGRPRG